MSNNNREVVVLSGVRTAVGEYGGSLKDIPAADLGAAVLKEAVSRAKIDPNTIGQVVFGNIIHSDHSDMYLGRVVALKGGLPVTTPGFTLNRLCGSGLQAVISASQYIMLGDIEAAVAGGAESMSRSPYWLTSTRWGQRMGDAQAIDVMVMALSDPFDRSHMGITAENVAEKYGVSRTDQDALALQSHQRATAATQNGIFKDQILPIEIKTRKGTVIFDKDEHIRSDISLEGLAKLKPAFKKDGCVTAGNASGVNDAAAALVLMERGAAEKKGLKPMARLVGYAHSAVEPKYMGIGPISAIRGVFEKTGLGVKDIDVIELNEAFAAQALAVSRELGLPADKTNPNGSGISLGHPVGASGAIITVKALYELQRVGGRYALVSLCIGGGQGIAAIFERLS